MTENNQKQRHCPTCRVVVTYEGNPHRPFCSERCRTQDLGNWAAEAYRIPAGPAPTEPDNNDETE